MPVLAIDFDLRHPTGLGADGPGTYRAALDMIAWAEDHGFARVTFGEHHQSPDGYLPAPLVFAAAVGGRTSSIRVRVSVLLAPLYDPVRLAEEVAVADLCLGGRLDLGMGVGYVEDDFDAFGADYHRRGAHLEWLVPFLRRAWTGEPFEHRGTTVTVTPRPVQDPMPIYLGGGTRAAIDRAVRLGDGFFAPAMERPWQYYRRASMEAGKPDPGEWPKRGPIFLWVTTGDKEQVWERLAPHVRHQIDSYGGWTQSGLGRPDGPFVPTRDIESLEQGGAYRVVDPDEAIALAQELGPDGELHLNPLLAGIAPGLAWEMLETVERHVLPHI
jgi:alkanesulfonate monooxygenase SsuD/methylene tetrahydromethanopterin reductase-like flavin-dependent oxidoreductase (luciferase family)